MLVTTTRVTLDQTSPTVIESFERSVAHFSNGIQRRRVIREPTITKWRTFATVVSETNASLPNQMWLEIRGVRI